MTTINPATGQQLQTYEEMSSKEVSDIIEKAHDAYLDWRDTPFSDRIKCMKKVADILEKNKKDYATLMANEMGKPITAGITEIEKCIWLCDYYADNIEELLKPKEIKTDFKKTYVTYKPTGVIFAIMPWNYPIWQVFRFAVPNLLAGNAGLLKHAPISTGTALIIDEIFTEAGFPHDLFRSLIIDVEEASRVIAHPHVTGVTLTGSERAGRAVAAEAGKALKKVVLELGGSDPYVVLEDADLDKAAETIVTSRMNNTGQVCIAAKRVIPVASVHEALKDKILEKLKAYQPADPLNEKTVMGPMAREDLRDEVHRQVQDSVKSGAKLICGGELPDGKGFYYPPTVLDHVAKGMPAYDQEIFGPVITFIPAKNEDEAIEIAKDTSYGLGAAVFTKDLARGEDIAVNKLRAGTCVVNTLVKSDPRLPFGGIKNSGFGRELSSEGLHEFLNIKTICVA